MSEEDLDYTEIPSEFEVTFNIPENSVLLSKFRLYLIICWAVILGISGYVFVRDFGSINSYIIIPFGILSFLLIVYVIYYGSDYYYAISLESFELKALDQYTESKEESN